MTGLLAYILSKKYTDNSIAGGGISAGKNCTIDSITDITGGHRVTFKWTLDNGTVQTGTMDVMDGVDGTDGTDGTDGFSPTISITEITGGHTVTITDAEGEHTFDVMDGQDGATELSDLTDLALTNVQDGQILQYDSASGKWKNVAGGSVDTDLGDLNDVDLTNIQDGQMIAWDAQNSKWVNVTPSADIESLNDIDDVDITNPSNGQMLKYNGTSEKWENSDMPTIDATPTENSTNAVQSGGVFTALGNKVDKVSGKQLSTEDYTTAEKTKLSGIETGAEANVQSDWNQSNNEADDFIKNKPTLGTAAAKDSTTYISPGNNDVPTANSVYQAMTSMLEGAFHPAGNKTCAELTSALLVQANVGNIYKITDNGTTDANWVGGAGQTITANQMAVVVYGNEPDTFLFNLENGINIDMSQYQTKSITPITVDGTAKDNVEDALSAINDLAAADKTAIGNIKDGQSIDSFGDVETALADKAGKVSSATNGHFAGLDANGNLTDSGKSASDFATPSDIQDVYKANGVLGAKNLYQLLKSDVRTNLAGSTFTLVDGELTINCTADEFSGAYLYREYIRPRFAFLANIPCILSFKYKSSVECDAQIGLDFSKITMSTEWTDYSKIVADPSSIGDIVFYTREASTAPTIYVKDIMLRLATDTDSTYQPCAETNKQLTDRPRVWSGHTADWNALSASEKSKYKYVCLDDDGETGDVVDAVTNGNMNPVTSNAVFDAIKGFRTIYCNTDWETVHEFPIIYSAMIGFVIVENESFFILVNYNNGSLGIEKVFGVNDITPTQQDGKNVFTLSQGRGLTVCGVFRV